MEPSNQFSNHLSLLIRQYHSHLFPKRRQPHRYPLGHAFGPLLVRIGIGRADKMLPNYAQQARNRALAEVASEITVSVANELVSTAVEKSGMLTQEVEEEIRSPTQAELESVDTVATWDGNQYYWIYCCLNKLDYANRQAEKVANAAGLALDLYQTATGNSESEQLTSLLSLYLQALLPTQNYLTQPLTVSLDDGSEIQLQNRIYAELQAGGDTC